jgi:hypothetical protein
VTAQLERQAASYLSAYRVHAVAVSREVVALRGRAARAATPADAAAAEAARAAQLSWYRAEALARDAAAAGLRDEVGDLRLRLRAETARADALQRQLMAALRAAAAQAASAAPAAAPAANAAAISATARRAAGPPASSV